MKKLISNCGLKTVTPLAILLVGCSSMRMPDPPLYVSTNTDYKYGSLKDDEKQKCPEGKMGACYCSNVALTARKRANVYTNLALFLGLGGAASGIVAPIIGNDPDKRWFVQKQGGTVTALSAAVVGAIAFVHARAAKAANDAVVISYSALKKPDTKDDVRFQACTNATAREVTESRDINEIMNATKDIE